MRQILGFLMMLSFISCSSVNKVSSGTYQCKASKLFGSCENLMAKTCPSGHKIESKDWSYGFGGAKDIVYFKCN